MSLESGNILPRILNYEEEDVLVPIKIDLTHDKGRYLDDFCWNLSSPLLTPEEFAWKTCMEENLAEELLPRMVNQINEQVGAFHSLIEMVRSADKNKHCILLKHLEHIVADVSVRCNVIEYSDTFQWNAYSTAGCDPEEFARQTCLDLGLPTEMQPVISLRLRETIIRSLLSHMESANVFDQPGSVSDIVSTIKLKLLQPNEVVNQVSSFWKSGKPDTRPKEAGFLNATIPKNQRTNAHVWM